MDTPEINNSQMKKGVLELCILSVLLKDEAYPSDVLEQLKVASLIIPEGTLYPILTRLKNGGYLSYRWVESTEGPPRKYFNLTAEGKQYLHQIQSQWLSLVNSVQILLNP